MENQNHEIKNVILGALIGSVIGGSTLYLLKTSHEHTKSPVCKIGKTISEFGEMIERSKFDNKKEAIQEIEKYLPEDSATLNTILEWIATGISLWNKIKKGD